MADPWGVGIDFTTERVFARLQLVYASVSARKKQVKVVGKAR
jgi:hypothetical protein